MRCKRELPYSCDLSVSDWLTNITSVGNMQSRITAKKAGVINKAARKVPTQCNDIVTTGPISLPHPDLKIRGGGIQTLRYVGGSLQNIFFGPLGVSLVWQKGGPGPLGPSPGSAAEFDWLKRLKRWLCSHLVSKHSTRVRCLRKVQGDIWVWTHRLFVSKPDQNSGAVRVQGRDHMYNHNSTIFSRHWCQLNCMHACLHR